MGNRQSQRKRRRAEEESIEVASTSSSISLEATSVHHNHYDVFLSFRGSDTRKEFIDHLYHSLVKVGAVPFRVFKDDKSIPIGEEFSPHILAAIKQSKIAIPVISENYASSKWCLRELACIMECKKSTSHMVFPIFYKVAPSDVRYLKGNFGNIFRSSQKHFDDKDIQDWQQALKKVSDLNGLESEKFAGGHEGELIECVVKTILIKLQEDFQLDIPKQLVGLDGHVKEIMMWTDSPSIKARMLGIYGMGGIGKTTFSKYIFNRLSNRFGYVSFLPDVRETTRRHGITYLQSQLISDILQKKSKVSRIDDGINIIKSRFRGKMVLILLDDVDDKNQLHALAGERSWFMEGSIIIVTTRNEAVLDQSDFEVDYKYELNGLNMVNALLLFNRHAFRMDDSLRDFEDISHDIISTMGGLPLALQVVGSYLYKKTNRQIWEDVRKQLKNQPHRDVQKILQISYDALEDGHKQIFLDIVCFFIGHKSKFAMYMWDSCGLYPSQAIEELKLRCLIRIGDTGEFKMHDQLRDLGRAIFCQGQPSNECCGPWDDDYKKITKVLRQQETLWFHHWMWEASNEDSNDLLSEVRWLQWCVVGSDLSLSTINLHLQPKLLVLDLSQSWMTEDWGGWSSIRASNRLRVLDLQSCMYLRCTPDLSTFTQLKILILKCCLSLEYLHPSIGKLMSLVSVDLTLCKRLKELPEEVGNLEELEELLLDDAGIIEIPTSIVSLWKLKKLSAKGCKSLREIPNSIGDLQNLQHLGISGAPLSDLPKSIRNLSSLRCLSLSGCDKLPLLPELPLGLTYLSISCQIPRLLQLSSLIHLEELHLLACDLLERLDLSRLIHLKRLRAECCNNVVEIQGIDNLEFLEDIFIEGCNSIERLLFLDSKCLKKLEVIDCNNLVEIRGLEGVKFSREKRFQVWRYVRS